MKTTFNYARWLLVLLAWGLFLGGFVSAAVTGEPPWFWFVVGWVSAILSTIFNYHYRELP